MIERLWKLACYRWRAKHLGVAFTRGRAWQLPSHMQFNGRRVELSAPNDAGTRNAFLDIFLADVYRVRKLPGPLRKVLDVGAHVGFFSMHVRMLHPEARVHAYEPNPALKGHLEAHATIAGFQVFSEALGGCQGRASLVPGRDSVFTQLRSDISGLIQVLSLDDALERLGGAADLVKLDCEGAEWEILRSNQTLRAVRHLTMEYHLVDGQSVEDLLQILSGCGFRICFLAKDHPTCGRVLATRQP